MSDNYIQDVLLRGKINANATKLISADGRYEFKSYNMGMGINVRVCPDLEAVLDEPLHRNTIGVTVGGKVLPKRFRLRRTAVAAAQIEAKRMGII
jgi:hypothetical protein